MCPDLAFSIGLAYNLFVFDRHLRKSHFIHLPCGLARLVSFPDPSLCDGSGNESTYRYMKNAYHIVSRSHYIAIYRYIDVSRQHYYQGYRAHTANYLFLNGVELRGGGGGGMDSCCWGRKHVARKSTKQWC